jgi:subtilisin family serine protease
MNDNHFRKMGVLSLTLIALFLIVIGSGNAYANNAFESQNSPASQALVEAGLREAIQVEGSGRYLVILKEQADLSAAYEIDDWEARGWYVYNSLRETASRSQADIINLLRRNPDVIDFQPYFILNAIHVTSGVATLDALAAQPAVDVIEAEKVFDVPEIVVENNILAPEWGVEIIRATEVWADFGIFGDGVVVASIDTGVQHTHPALQDKYRGTATGSHDFNFFDPAGICGGGVCDNNGHGTHVTGTMVGDDGGANQIGVAPDAQWIAAKGCEANSCSDTSLLASAEWMLAPCAFGDAPGAPSCDPAMRPHVINNSWGGPGGDAWYQPSVNAWRAAGMIPVFSAGNSGPGAGTIGSPSDYCNVLSIGGTNSTDGMYPSSSRGPGAFPGCTDKPDVSAPGQGVRSSVPTNSYATFSGTSMASPHVSGCIALMMSVAPMLEYDEIYDILTTTAADLGAPGFDYDYGNGRIDCYEAVSAAIILSGPFSMAVAPESVDACVPNNAVYNIDVLQNEAGYTAPVTLSVLGVPAGYTPGFSVNPVAVPGSSVLTLTGGAAAYGSYSLDIVGVSLTNTHTSTVGLNLFTAVPGGLTLTGPADGATNVLLQPTFSWDDATQAADYYLELATDAGFTNVIYTATTDGTSYQATAVLDPLTTYYWRVTASNPCGDGATSAAFSFETRDIPPILLVDDDDGGPDVRSYYTDILDGMGLFYDVWNTNGSDNEPSAAELAPYDMVIWFTGAAFGGAAGPGAAGEAALTSWLDDGNCLFISSQDYLWDRGLTPFMQSHLGVATFGNDVSQTTVTGAGSLFGGLGPYTLSYPFSNYSDRVSPDATAELAFTGNQGDAAVNKDSGLYRATFWGFPFEALSAVAREETMQVIVDWCGAGGDTGVLVGTVTDADSGDPIAGATVDAGLRSVTTNNDGEYSMTLPIGAYDVTASATNYQSVSFIGIEVFTDTITTQDFALAGSHLTYSPPFIEEAMEIGDVVTNTVTVTNTGPLPIDWSAAIGNYVGPNAAVRVVPLTVAPLNSAAPAFNPLADVDLVLDDGTRDDSLGLTTGGQFIWLNRFTPDPADFPFSLTEVQILFGQDVGVNVGELVDIYVYEDTDGDGNPGTGANFLGSILDAAVQAVDDVTFSVYPVAAPIVLNGPGDVLIAVVNRTAGVAAGTFPASMDQTSSAGRSWVGIYSAGNPGNPPTLPADELWGTVDSFEFPGNFMVRGYGSFGASGGWAYADPASGAIPANSVATFAVVFDASSLFATGTYAAELTFSGSFVNDPPTMPLTMTLGCTTCGFLEGAITDDRTGDPLAAMINITGPGGFDVTLSGDSYSNIAVQPGSYTIAVSADGYYADSAVAVVAQGETTITDFALVPIYGELVYSPDAIEEFMAVGDVVVNTVTVTNTGTAPLNFSVSIGNYDGPAAVRVVPRASAPMAIEPLVLFTGASKSSPLASETAVAAVDSGESIVSPLTGFNWPLSVLYDNGPLVTHPGGGGGGADASALQTAINLDVFGFGVQQSAGNRLADDFEVTGAGWTVDTIALFGYQTGSSATSTFTGVNLRIWDGVPGQPGSAIVFGDTTTNRMTATAWSNIYRVLDTSLTNTDRPIMYVVADVEGIFLPAGTYWVDWQLNGTLSSGPWAPPISILGQTTTGNALQFIDGVWSPVLDSGTNTAQGFPFIIEGGGGSGAWASAAPDSGMVPAGESVTFDVIFDATALLQEGTYTAELSFSGDFENSPPVMPLTMHLECPTCGFLTGDITDALTGDPLTAAINIIGDGGLDITVVGDSYSLSVPADAYTITVSAEGYFDEMGLATVTAGETVITDFALTPIYGELSYAPESVEVTVGWGGMLTESFFITNDGTAPFTFSLSDAEIGNPFPGLANSPAVVCPPDAFGYTCTDSTEADGLVTYNFEDISATGTAVSLGDDAVSPALPMGFAFDYYGIEYSNVYISSNGFLTVLPGQPNGCCTGGVLPATTTPNGVIAGWWEDLNPSGGGTIHYQVMGDAPSRYFIVQFTDVPHFGGGNLVTKQYKLFEGSNNIEVHYLAAPSDGGTHSAGIENHDGTIGLQYYRGTAALPSELAVCYLYPGQTICGSGGDAEWLAQSPASGTVEPGETVEIGLLFDATAVSASGTYTAELYFAGDFDNMVAPMTVVMHVEPPQASIELAVTVALDPDSCGTANSLMVPVGTTVYYCYTVENMGNIMLPNHTITDSVYGPMMSFVYDLMPGMIESVIISKTIMADAVSTVQWMAENPGMDMWAMAEDTVSVMVYTYGVELHAAVADLTGAPGATVAYTIHITNTGNVTDVFDINVGGDDWLTSAMPLSVELGAGEMGMFYVMVEIPDSAADGDSDLATVMATSRSDAEAMDALTLTTTAEIETYTLFLPIIIRP